MKKISTTQLAKKQEMAPKELFSLLSDQGLIERKDNKWILTGKGEERGGDYKESAQYGKYIVWPDTLKLGNEETTSPPPSTTEKLFTSTAIGKHFDLSATKINFILSEIGWIKKGLKGWLLTEQGKKQGGQQAEDGRTGVPYAKWPESLLTSKALIETVEHVKGTYSEQENEQHQDTGVKEKTSGFREKFEAKHRATDGHFVRSKAEMLIDNWLYMAEIVHVYERKLPVEENVYSDFYIPTGKVYIEYWGYENDEKYLARKKTKQEIYQKYGFNLIELEDKEVQNLDDILPRLLLKFGVQAY
ncbi:MAG: glycerol kinase [Candidatus Electrothrix sp. AW1]|nr:glycerol kinase [Candidatus Electrothrix sp. AX1]MCI5182656.1 glycerol kinase [Candidatus Electrothrix gigas]